MTMKRVLLVLTLAVLCVTGLSAQALEQNKPAVFGVRIGADLNLPSSVNFPEFKMKSFKPGGGVSLGAVVYMPMIQNFYIQPGVSVYYDTFKSDLGVMDDNVDVQSYYDNAYKIGFRIPVLFGYKFNFTETVRMMVYTGPEFNVSFAGHYTGKELPKLTLFEEQRRFDLAWNIGLGFPVNDFMISVDGSFGLTDLYKASPVSYHENRLTVGLTYFF